MSTAIEDIEALATELETSASEHRQQAEECDRRAQALRDAAAQLIRKEGALENPFQVHIGHTDPGQLIRDATEHLQNTHTRAQE